MPCALQGCAQQGWGSSAVARSAGTRVWKNTVKIMMLSVLSYRRQKIGRRHISTHIVMRRTCGAVAGMGRVVTPAGYHARGVPQGILTRVPLTLLREVLNKSPQMRGARNGMGLPRQLSPPISGYWQEIQRLRPPESGGSRAAGTYSALPLAFMVRKLRSSIVHLPIKTTSS